MMQHPTIAAALGQERRATMIAEAERARLAREARAGRGVRGHSAKQPALRRLFRIPATRNRLARLRPARAR